MSNERVSISRLSSSLVRVLPLSLPGHPPPVCMYFMYVGKYTTCVLTYLHTRRHISM